MPSTINYYHPASENFWVEPSGRPSGEGEYDFRTEIPSISEFQDAHLGCSESEYAERTENVGEFFYNIKIILNPRFLKPTLICFIFIWFIVFLLWALFIPIWRNPISITITAIIITSLIMSNITPKV